MRVSIKLSITAVKSAHLPPRERGGARAGGGGVDDWWTKAWIVRRTNGNREE